MILTFLLSVLTNAASLAHNLRTADVDGQPFEFSATVTFPGLSGQGSIFAVEDASGPCVLRRAVDSVLPTLQAGDVIRLKGRTRRLGPDPHSGAFEIQAEAQSIIRQAVGNRPPIPTTRASDILSGRTDGRCVQTAGILRDVFLDEIDPEWCYLLIQQGRETLAAILKADNVDVKHLRTFMGARISLSGLCYRTEFDARKLLTSALYLTGPEALSVLEPAPADPFAVPTLEPSSDLQERNLDDIGRRRVTGRVLATWDGRHLLLTTGRQRLVGVEFADATTFVHGDTVEVVGYPETDLYRINLSSASGRLLSHGPPDTAAAENVEAKNLLTDGHGNRAVQVLYHGRLIRLTGTVRPTPADLYAPTRLILDCDGYDVSVSADALADSGTRPVPGSRLSVCGICVIEVANRRPSTPFPHVSGILLVPRTASDIIVLSRPPWWTPGRLLTLLGIFAAALLGVIGWNGSLNRRARAKGRELAAEQLAHVTSELKVNERTRLAVELHDALSQTMTGVSMQIDTAAGIINESVKTHIAKLFSKLGAANRTEAVAIALRKHLLKI